MGAALFSRVARKILAQSLRVKKGESLTVETWNNGLPFAREVVKEARRIGCIPIMLLEDEAAYLDGVKKTPREILGRMGRHEYSLLSGSNAYVFIPGPLLGTYTRRITRQQFIDSTKYNDSWYEAAKKANLRGVRMTFGYVGRDVASLLRRNVKEIVEHQLRASLVDLKKLAQKAKRLSAELEDGKDASIESKGMNLSFQLKGELEVQDGVTSREDLQEGDNLCYVPPGYVDKEVESSSVSGRVRLSPSLTRFGMLGDATLEFQEGKIVSWASRGSEDILTKLGRVLPEKGRVLSDVMIGLNPVMKFGYGQDRFPSGSVSIGVGFRGILQGSIFSVGGRVLVKAGKLA